MKHPVVLTKDSAAGQAGLLLCQSNVSEVSIDIRGCRLLVFDLLSQRPGLLTRCQHFVLSRGQHVGDWLWSDILN